MKLNIIWLFLLSLFFVVCSKTSDEDLFILGIEEFKNNNVDQAYKYFEQLVDEYPQSELAAESLFLMADILQNKQVEESDKKNDLKQAVELYLRVQYNFPNDEKAPQALFMAGFVSSEMLKDYDAATLYYKRFMKIYPDHELVVSVQEEINNLGKTPEEILLSKKAAIPDKVSSK
jgi:TolA-binding protein